MSAGLSVVRFVIVGLVLLYARDRNVTVAVAPAGRMNAPSAGELAKPSVNSTALVALLKLFDNQYPLDAETLIGCADFLKLIILPVDADPIAIDAIPAIVLLATIPPLLAHTIVVAVPAPARDTYPADPAIAVAAEKKVALACVPRYVKIELT
jgi:hypothetical protein